MSFQTAIGHTSERKDDEIEETGGEQQQQSNEYQKQQQQQDGEYLKNQLERLTEQQNNSHNSSDSVTKETDQDFISSDQDSVRVLSSEENQASERSYDTKSEDKMEFTKNYSDDLLMGQNDGTQATNADLADFELPPYSGSSSGSDQPTKQQSPTGRKSSSSSSSTTHHHQQQQQASSSHQQPSSAGFRGLINLLTDTYSQTSHVLQWKKPIESGIYFGIGVTLIIAFTFFSIISVVAYSALGVIMTSGLIKLYKSVMQTLNKSPELPIDHVWDKIQCLNVTISQDRVHEFIDVSLGNINSSLIYFKQVLLFEDKIATLKVSTLHEFTNQYINHDMVTNYQI